MSYDTIQQKVRRLNHGLSHIGVVMTNSNFIPKKEVVRILGVSPSTVSRWANSGDIPKPFKLGQSKIVWDKTEIEDYINEIKKVRGFLGHKPGESNKCQ